jgi:hypothetical protein
VLIDINKLSDIHIIKDSSGANTPDKEANDFWHCHLVELSLKKILILIEAIRKEKKERVSEKQIKHLIQQGITSGQISDLKNGMLEKID